MWSAWDAVPGRDTHGGTVSGEANDKDVEEFAALLRRLKARTDRSYSQLARRLNMNASTLHRYCVGEAVPLDFAPVERFAALCEAAPEERLELHRYWILAVAARQRPRVAATPAENPLPEPVPDEAPEPPRRRPWYRRRLTLTAAVVCATLAAWGTLSAVSTHDTAKPKASPRALPAPLTWTANSQVWTIHCSHDYVVDKSPAQVPPPPAPENAGAWAAKQHAVHGHDTNIEISVQGRTSTAVVLEALRVRVVGRTAPAHGTAYAMDQGCGGGLVPRYFGVNLDARRPLALPAAGSDDLGNRTPALHLPYRVSAQDPEVLLVKAQTQTCDCRWYLELDWSSQGRTGTLRIDDHGKPFRTTSIKGLPHYWYSAKGWAPYDG
ncbi:helix-turn-helix domain-containing protein [Streptomyces xylophagus]|uniref:helix-turn-helix domain-containing protein n=1 Tax=Streptomyces xylophagus TaxID=285514 RepID=UPI000D13B951|nr:helix-turn-helix transcriptional regulator [Streptomyces xylophagus]